MMRVLRNWLVVLPAVFVAGCTAFEQVGVAVDRSMVGVLTATDITPSGASYLLAHAQEGNFSAEPLTFRNGPEFIGVTLVREGPNFRVMDAAGFAVLPPGMISDSRTLFAIPGQRDRYVMEFVLTNEDGDRMLAVTLAERRCQGDTCVLAIATQLPIGDDDGDVPLPNLGDEWNVLYSGEAFAAAISQIAARMSPSDFNHHYLIYRASTDG
jgi:hypothetical protein